MKTEMNVSPIISIFISVAVMLVLAPCSGGSQTSIAPELTVPLIPTPSQVVDEATHMFEASPISTPVQMQPTPTHTPTVLPTPVSTRVRPSYPTSDTIVIPTVPPVKMAPSNSTPVALPKAGLEARPTSILVPTLTPTPTPTPTPVPPTLALVATTTVEDGEIWSVPVWDGRHIVLTYARHQKLWARRFDRNLKPVDNPVQVTLDSDPVVTDHKHLFLNGMHFVTFATPGDANLYMLKLDSNLIRLALVPVVEGVSRERTNDMLLGTDGELLLVGRFCPCGEAGAGHVFTVFDQDLTKIGSEVDLLKPRHTNMASIVFANDAYHIFSFVRSNMRDRNSPSALIQLDVDATTLRALSQGRIVKHHDTDFYHASTGIVYDQTRKLYYGAYIRGRDMWGTGTVVVEVFDPSNWASLATIDVAEGNRPHLTLMNNNMLVIGWDEPGVNLGLISLSSSTVAVTPIPLPTRELLPALLSFAPDSGIRMNLAALAKATIGEDGLTYLFYEDKSMERLKDPIASSHDGLVFGEGESSDSSVRHPYAVHLPDGTWRNYILSKDNVITSESSVDGKEFTEDQGIRYSPSQVDKGTLGTYDVFVDRDGGVVLLYVGDLRGLNNVRMAYSPPEDNGWSFSYAWGNVLGDDDAGGGSRTYVDIKSVELPDGRRLLTAMKGGSHIYSFISDVTLKLFTLETGVRLSASDFTELDVVSLHDPMVTELPDGRFRMYLHLHIRDEKGADKTVIVSATTDHS